MKKFQYVIAGAIILLLPLNNGCKKTEDKTPPELPPYESMAIDFSKLKVASKSISQAQVEFPVENMQTKTNWQFAAGTVGFWNTLLGLTLVVPVASFYSAISQKATYLGNAKWEWKYSLTGLLSTYSARLTGEVRASDIKWEMYITKTGDNSFPEFKWFEGTSSLDGNSGQWILYHSYQFQEELLQIDWTKTAEKIGQIKYTYVRVLNDNRVIDKFNGSYLTFGLQSSYYDAYYNIHFYESITQQFVDAYIEWSTTLYYGHVKAFYKFNDNNWHCWDNTGTDIVCVN